MKKRIQEIAVYVDEGLVRDVTIVDKRKPYDKWKDAIYTLIDYDVEGADEDVICRGCLYADYPHFYDYCRREQRKKRKAK